MVQYIAVIKRRLKDRFNKHRRAVDKTNIKSKPITVSEHFLSHPNHSHTDMKLFPLEKIYSSRESHLSLEPNGLNIVIPFMNSVTSVNLKKAGMASRNIVMKNNTRCSHQL